MKTQHLSQPTLEKVAINLGSIKQNWNAFKNSPMPEHMLAGATVGGALGSIGGAAYGYDQDYDTQDRYARNGMLGGALVGALGGVGTGYRQAVHDAMDHVVRAGAEARFKGTQRAYDEAERQWKETHERAKQWREYVDDYVRRGGAEAPFDHARNAVGSAPAPRVHVNYDDARHGAPLRKVWDTLQSSAEFHDPAVASAASEFMSAVGTAKGTPEYLKSLIAKMPPGSKASELFRVMMNRNIKTSAYLATRALFGLPT